MGLLRWCLTTWSGSSDRVHLTYSMVSHGIAATSSHLLDTSNCVLSFNYACFPPLHQRIPATLNHLLSPSISRLNNQRSRAVTKQKMRLLSFLSQFLSVSNSPRQLLDDTSQIPTSPLSSHSVFSLTRHSQVLPAPKPKGLSTTMLATMPCTPFNGRPPHEFGTFLTHEFPGSTAEHVHSKIMRKRPEKILPVSFEFEGREIGEIGGGSGKGTGRLRLCLWWSGRLHRLKGVEE